MKEETDLCSLCSNASGNVQQIESIIKKDGIEKFLNCKNALPFFTAVVNNHFDVVKLFFKYATTKQLITTENKACLYYCIQEKKLDMAKYLIEMGVDWKTAEELADFSKEDALHYIDVLSL